MVSARFFDAVIKKALFDGFFRLGARFVREDDDGRRFGVVIVADEDFADFAAPVKN